MWCYCTISNTSYIAFPNKNRKPTRQLFETAAVSETVDCRPVDRPSDTFQMLGFQNEGEEQTLCFGRGIAHVYLSIRAVPVIYQQETSNPCQTVSTNENGTSTTLKTLWDDTNVDKSLTATRAASLFLVGLNDC